MSAEASSTIGLARRYFDAPYYLAQVNGAVAGEPFEHYISVGSSQGLHPCKYFAHDWYAWQNPDYNRNHDNAFLHYLDEGMYQLRDPSPLVDMVQLDRAIGFGLAPADVADCVLSGRAPIGIGVYSDFSDLELKQRNFYSAIRPISVRVKLPNKKRRNLVIVQAGASGLHHEWFDKSQERSWDICVNLYSALDSRLDGAEYIIAQAGTKSTAMAVISKRFRSIWQDYDYILFLDDDISVDMQTLDRMFATCAAYKLDAAQMTLSSRSNCIWPLFFNQKPDGIRFTNGVEIMMPILSKRCFDECSDLFGQSVSGFGLDLAIGKRAAELGSKNIAVLDNCVVEHLKPIDTSGGALYSYLRSVGINPKAELWQMKTQHKTPRTFEEVDA